MSRYSSSANRYRGSRGPSGLLLLAALALCAALTGCGGEKEDTSTALGIMRKYNKAQPQDIDDNYRSCYEVFVYSFYDSNGDGIGDLKGLTERLDYINDGDPSTDTDLGCTGIWLMPIMPSPSYHKYDVTDYMSIDPQYGDMEDFFNEFFGGGYGRQAA